MTAPSKSTNGRGQNTPGGYEADADVTLSDGWIRELIECPICYEIPRPPIKQCLTGHIICNKCLPKTDDTCPLCRNMYWETRNFVAEGIVENLLPIRCKYAKNGCEILTKRAELGAHEARCEFRPVICPWCPKGVVDYDAYANHILDLQCVLDRVLLRKKIVNETKTEFSGTCRQNITKVTSSQPEVERLSTFTSFGQVFSLQLAYLNDSTNKSSIDLWVSSVAPEQDYNCINYKVDIQFWPRGKGVENGWKTKYPGYIRTFRHDEEHDILEEEGFRLLIPISEMLQKSVKPCEMWGIRVTLYNRADEG